MLGFITGVIFYWVMGLLVIPVLAKLDLITLTLNDLENDKWKVFFSVSMWWLILIVIIFKNLPKLFSKILNFMMTKIFRMQQLPSVNEIPTPNVMHGQTVNNQTSVTTPLSSTSANVSVSTLKTKKEKPKKKVVKDGSERFKMMDL